MKMWMQCSIIAAQASAGAWQAPYHWHYAAPHNRARASAGRVPGVFWSAVCMLRKRNPGLRRRTAGVVPSALCSAA